MLSSKHYKYLTSAYIIISFHKYFVWTWAFIWANNDAVNANGPFNFVFHVIRLEVIDSMKDQR